MKRKRTRPDPTARTPLGPFMVSIRPTGAGIWKTLNDHLEDLRTGESAAVVESLMELEKKHADAFYCVALRAIALRDKRFLHHQYGPIIAQLHKDMGWPQTAKARRSHEGYNLARALYLFLNFMKTRWGTAEGVLARYLDAYRKGHRKDPIGAGAVLELVEVAGYKPPRLEAFRNHWCYRPGSVDELLAADRMDSTFVPMPFGPSSPVPFPPLVGMVWKGKGPFIIGGANDVPKDPDALAALVAKGPAALAFVSMFSLCMSHPAEVGNLAKTIPAIGNIPALMARWRKDPDNPDPGEIFLVGVSKDTAEALSGAYGAMQTIVIPGTPGTPGACAEIPRKTRTEKRHK